MPPRVEYFITDEGLTLIPIIRMLEEWGNNFRPRMQEILKQEK